MDAHPEDVKAELRKAGITLASLARLAGVSAQAVSAGLHSRTSERIDNVIAHALNKHPHEIWPSRYQNDGQRIRFTRGKDEREAA